ncbi:MAG: hypothetical protein KAU21_18935, partial [Gammaproteobacteria bacterium]|nr:hypothetical protein [Gammaproteobacteria bacterium]
ALGAAYLAGLGAGCFESTEELSSMWQKESLFSSSMDSTLRNKLLGGWQQAISCVGNMSTS